MQIKFKASRKKSRSCDGYRQIIKSGDLQYDSIEMSDDGIILLRDDYESGKKLGGRIIIDCDKKTGIFSLKFDYK